MATEKNWRRNPFTGAYNTVEQVEVYQVPVSQTIQLKEYPLYGTVGIKPLADTTANYSEDSVYPPLVSTFYVDYIEDANYPATEGREGTGQVFINVTSGTWVVVKYAGMGKILLDEDTRKDTFSNMNIDNNYNTGSGLADIVDAAAPYAIQGLSYMNNYIYLYNHDRVSKIDLAGNKTAVTGGTYHQINKVSRIHIAACSDGRFYISYTGDYITVYNYRSDTNQENYTTAGALELTGGAHLPGPGCQVGDFYYFALGTNLLKTNLNDGTTQTYTLPNNWAEGAACFGEGYIYLYGNQAAGDPGQVLKISVYDGSYSSSIVTAPAWDIANGSMMYYRGKLYIPEMSTGMPYEVTALDPTNTAEYKHIRTEIPVIDETHRFLMWGSSWPSCAAAIWKSVAAYYPNNNSAYDLWPLYKPHNHHWYVYDVDGSGIPQYRDEQIDFTSGWDAKYKTGLVLNGNILVPYVHTILVEKHTCTDEYAIKSGITQYKIPLGQIDNPWVQT